MKKVSYILKDMVIDFKENLRLILYSAVLAFVGLFFLANIEKTANEMQIFLPSDDVYFLSVSNQNCTENDLVTLGNDYNFVLHDVERNAVNVDGEYAECYLYDSYILNNLNYELSDGRNIENENEVILSSDFKEIYEVGDSILLAGSDDEGNYIEKEKTICGFLKNDTIYYPNGSGDIYYDLLIVNLEDDSDLYYNLAVITNDADYGSSDTDYVIRTFMLEALDGFDYGTLSGQITDFGFLYTGESLISENENNLSYEQNQKKVFVVAGLTLGLSIFMGGIYISIIRHKKESGILMLTGATFKETFILLKMPGILSVILGIILGEGLSVCVMKNDFLEGEWNILQMTIVAAVIAFIYILCSLILEIIWNKKSIIDLIKR